MPTAKDAIREAVRTLRGSEAIGHYAGSDRFSAEDLLTFVLGREPLGGEALQPAALRRFRYLIERRAKGVPVAYLTGRTPFMELSLEIGPGAFVPRQSSEWLVEQALRRLRRRTNPVHLDVATGIGPVALGVANGMRSARVFGIDLSSRPLALARRNAARLGLDNASFLQGDLFAPLPRELLRQVDVITGHLPYVGDEELATLPEEILRFEPKESLTDFSPTGLSLLTRMATEAPEWLRPKGWLLMEVSPDRSRRVAAVFRSAGLRDVRSTMGELRVSRVIVGRT